MVLPIQLCDLRGSPVLVAGGGAIAARKVEELLAEGAEIRVVTLAVGPELAPLVGRLAALELRGAEEADVIGQRLVFAATGDREANRRLAEAAKRRGIWVNAADDPEASSFYSTATVRRGPVTISVGTEGRAPLLAAQLRRWLEAALPPSVSALGRLLAEARQDGIRGLARRGAMLRALGDPWLARAVDLGAIDRAKERWIALNRATEEPFSPGTVAIAGAGPGGRAHLTLRALDRIQRADVIVHDALVSEEILGEAMPDARKLAMGRRAGAGGPDPALVCSLLIKEARQGHRVLRLHAGDPGVFGRGGEEVEALERAGVSCQLIPGVSAVLAAPAAAGIPLTLRGVARGFRVRTGHTKEGYRAALEPVPEEDTLVIVMGLGNAKEIFAQLIAEGRAADTPAVAVEAASCPQERVIAGTLGDLAARIEAAKLEAPVTLIVGAVAQRAREKAALEEAAA